MLDPRSCECCVHVVRCRAVPVSHIKSTSTHSCFGALSYALAANMHCLPAHPRRRLPSSSGRMQIMDAIAAVVVRNITRRRDVEEMCSVVVNVAGLKVVATHSCATPQGFSEKD